MLVMIKEFLRRHLRLQQSGQGLVEYALIILLIALVAIGAVTIFGGQLAAAFEGITASVP